MCIIYLKSKMWATFTTTSCKKGNMIRCLQFMLAKTYILMSASSIPAAVIWLETLLFAQNCLILTLFYQTTRNATSKPAKTAKWESLSWIRTKILSNFPDTSMDGLYAQPRKFMSTMHRETNQLKKFPLQMVAKCTHVRSCHVFLQLLMLQGSNFVTVNIKTIYRHFCDLAMKFLAWKT